MTSSVEVRFELRVSCCWMVARYTVRAVATAHSQTEWTEPPRARSQRAQPPLLRLVLTLHGFGNAHVIELGESLHHSLQLCVPGIPVAAQLVSRFLRSGTLLLLQLHVLSSATSCTVSCFRTVSAKLETDFSSVALIIWTSRARDQHCRRQLARRNSSCCNHTYSALDLSS